MRTCSLLPWVTLVLVVLCSPVMAVATPGTPAATEPAAVTALDGRLGGTRASFERLYGPSRASGIDHAFDLSGYGLVQVQFGGADQTGPALVITLRSPRDPNAPATQLQDADWSVGKARQRVKRFLPDDVHLGELNQLDAGSATLTCASATIAEVFGELGGEHGNCRVGFIMPTKSRVSFATIALTGDADPDTRAAGEMDACDGLVTWANATGSRLARAQSAIDAVTAIPDGATDAADQLTAAAATFTALTDEQRAEPAPGVAATANYYLIRGFKEYADALVMAAAAVTEHSPEKAAAAADGFASAAGNIGQGVAELQSAIVDCGFSPATPSSAADSA